MLEFEALLITRAGGGGPERTIGGAAREVLEVGGGGTEPGHDAVVGQDAEIGERADAPAVEDLVSFEVDGEGFQAELAEIFRFGAVRDEGDAGEIAGGEDGGIGRSGDADVAGEPAFGGAACDFAGDLRRRPDELAQGSYGQYDCVSRRYFDEWRK